MLLKCWWNEGGMRVECRWNAGGMRVECGITRCRVHTWRITYIPPAPRSPRNAPSPACDPPQEPTFLFQHRHAGRHPPGTVCIAFHCIPPSAAIRDLTNSVAKSWRGTRRTAGPRAAGKGLLKIPRKSCTSISEILFSRTLFTSSLHIVSNLWLRWQSTSFESSIDVW